MKLWLIVGVVASMITLVQVDSSSAEMKPKEILQSLYRFD